MSEFVIPVASDDKLAGMVEGRATIRDDVQHRWLIILLKVKFIFVNERVMSKKMF